MPNDRELEEVQGMKRGSKIRQHILGVPVTVAEQTEACFGAALLALLGGAP
jgi:hypothetical protein